MNGRGERIFGKDRSQLVKGKRERERKERAFNGSQDRRHAESSGLLPFVRVIDEFLVDVSVGHGFRS